MTHNNQSVPSNQQILGGKYLESDLCSAGLLDLPPLSKKDEETSLMTEIFVVVAWEHKKLKFIIGEKCFYLSRNCVIHIPDSNLYSLENISQTQSAKLLFILLKNTLKDEDSDNNNNNDN